MKFLIDTDIVLFLALGPSCDFGIHTYSALSLQKFGRKGLCSLWIHPVSIEHILKNYDGERIHQIKEHMESYGVVDSPLSVMGYPKKSSSDHAENCFMAALKTDAVDFFVTEKITLHQKAGKMGLHERVLFLSDAAALLKDLFGNRPMVPPFVEQIPLSAMKNNDPIFCIPGYDDDFEASLIKFQEKGCDAIVVKDKGCSAIAGICIFKTESGILTVCLINVAPSYAISRYGELLLKSVFEVASVNSIERIFFSAFPGEEKFEELAESFGFEPREEGNSVGTGSVSYCKRLIWEISAAENQSPLEFHRSFGPMALSFHKNSTWVLPMGPLCHQTLFPELEEQLPLFPEPRPHGNPIQRALLCPAFTRKIEPGDNLLIYRTRGRSGITAIGVVEETLVPSCPDEAVRYLGTRTVYTHTEIVHLCRNPLLAIKFRYVRGFTDPLRLTSLKKHGVLKGVPRGVTKVKKEGISFLREKMAQEEINTAQESLKYLIFP